MHVDQAGKQRFVTQIDMGNVGAPLDCAGIGNACNAAIIVHEDGGILDHLASHYVEHTRAGDDGVGERGSGLNRQYRRGTRCQKSRFAAQVISQFHEFCLPNLLPELRQIGRRNDNDFYIDDVLAMARIKCATPSHRPQARSHASFRKASDAGRRCA